MRIVAIINSGAGSFTTFQRSGIVKTISAAFQQVGVDAEVRVTKAKYLTEAAKEALLSGADAIIAGGGDGTISTVASVIVGTDMPLGVLPLGTLNHFAKDLEIPLDLEEAARVVAQGKVTAIDVAEVNGRVFVNNSSIGLYPQIVKRREGLRQRFGRNKWIAMLLAALMILRRFPLHQVRLSADGETLRRTTPFVFVGNNEYSIDLFTLGTRATLQDGILCLYIPNCSSRFSMLKLTVQALSNSLEQATDFETKSVQEVWIETRRKKVRVSLDGEVFRMRPPLHYRILPKALKVILPHYKSIGE
ncbi:MAG: diacylglycerol kinase family lipid kinase [Blastocatellia bacterium]|nr:diacylglycerol kinase family lipid kinase [Blastocatellia bacterium]